MRYKEQAIVAAIKAGIAILKIYNDPNQDFSIEKKADNSPLTIADKKSHEIIEAQLNTTPYPILSEEGTSIPYSQRKDWTTFWLIDPLDGTKEFIKKNGEFTVNIALITNGKPILGIIYVPVSKELYWGEESTGAWKLNDVSHPEININQGAIQLPILDKDKKFTVVGSRSHSNDETKAYINALKKEHSEIDIISKGSSLKICMVAEGRANEYPRFGPTIEWDTGAGHAIATAAGKHVTTIDKAAPLTYNKENLLNPYFIVW